MKISKEEFLDFVRAINLTDEFRDSISEWEEDAENWFVYQDQWGHLEYQLINDIGAQLYSSSRTKVVASFVGRRLVWTCEHWNLDGFYISKYKSEDMEGHEIDILSIVLKEMKTYFSIEKQFDPGQKILSKGIILWWFNTTSVDVCPCKATQLDTSPRPKRFLGNDDWILICKTVDGDVTMDANA